MTDPGFTLPLGPHPIATTTLNTGPGSDGLTLATQVSPYSIVTDATNVGICTTGMIDDGIGGDPLFSEGGGGFTGFNANFDFRSVHLDSFVVPVPAAVWLFGSGLMGLAAVARQRKKKA